MSLPHLGSDLSPDIISAHVSIPKFGAARAESLIPAVFLADV